MGNRGTTPSWDDEQIARYGLFAHLGMMAAPHLAEAKRRAEKLIAEYLDEVMATLSDQSEETRERVKCGIPDTIIAYDMSKKGLTKDGWQVSIAMEMYEDSCRRAGKKYRTPYPDLPPREQLDFVRLVEAIVEVSETRSAQAETA